MMKMEITKEYKLKTMKREETKKIEDDENNFVSSTFFK